MPETAPQAEALPTLCLNSPSGIAVDGAGRLYIADTYHHQVWRVDASGTLDLIAGCGQDGFSGDGGPAAEARLNLPKGLAVDGRGSIYIADSGNHRIRKVRTDGVIVTVAGTDRHGFSGDDGPATEASLYHPVALVFGRGGNLYIADTLNHRIRKVDAEGRLTTVAGGGSPLHGIGDGGPATSARLSHPHGLAWSADGKLIIADSGHHRIRVLSPGGTLHTLAGSGEGCTGSFTGDHGPAAQARLCHPKGIALDAAGNLWIADSGNGRVRRITPEGIITTEAGTGRNDIPGAEGSAKFIALGCPVGVVAHRDGHLSIADSWENCVLTLDREGWITQKTGTPPSPAEAAF